jgi:hypothetical protein
MQMNPKIKNYFFGFVLLPLAVFALITSAKKNLGVNEFAPLMVMSSFKSCLAKAQVQLRFYKKKIKKCNEVKGSMPIFFRDSNIFYQGNDVIGIQGQDSPDGRWYQVDTTDERYIRVVKYEE